MLAYLLAIVIALGSFSFYMAAFFVPEVHRRQDFLWSGVGMFYALVLWFCAGRITGAVLLGQVASVGLLGWLGFQTLELRRALTPEAVRTPADWADVQRWLQLAQQTLSQYVKMDSLLTGASAALADASAALSTLKNRIAGPRGQQDPASTVPPLKRSPAYEFETEAGQGEAVPSEFATVATRKQQEIETRDRATTPPTPETLPTSKTTEEVATEASPLPDKAPTDEVTATERRVAATSQPETAVPPSTPAKRSQPKQRQPITTEPTSPKRSQKKGTNPITGLGLWVGDVVKGLRKPKPQRSVIEIPPRPPSIPRSGETAKAKPQGSDPSSSTTRPTATSDSKTNWVDMGDRENEPVYPPPDTDFTPASEPTPVAEQASSPTVDQASNGSDIEPNWPVEAPPAATVTASEKPETNWPDEADEQNWPSEPAPSNSPEDIEEESNWPD